MKKTVKETLQWHPVEIKFPENMVTCLLQTNDGIFMGFWNKQLQKWLGSGVGGTIMLNSDTHVKYWTYWPKGVGIEEFYS